MLNKKICMKCVHERHLERWDWLDWEDADDYWWNNGYILCRCNECENLRSIKIEAPEWCPYSLEHLLKDQNVK